MLFHGLAGEGEFTEIQRRWWPQKGRSWAWGPSRTTHSAAVIRRSLARDTLYYAAASPARVKVPRSGSLQRMTFPLGATTGQQLDEEFCLALRLLLPGRVGGVPYSLPDEAEKQSFSQDDMFRRLADRPFSRCGLPCPLRVGDATDGPGEFPVRLVEPVQDLRVLLRRYAGRVSVAAWCPPSISSFLPEGRMTTPKIDV